MGLKDTRSKAIECLLAGQIQATNRPDVRDKNLLKTGVVTVEQVIELLKLTRGSQYRSEPHDSIAKVVVHYFEPKQKGEDWHIKLYFLEPDCWFISVHKSHILKGQRRR